MEKHCSFASDSDCVWFLLTIAKKAVDFIFLLFFICQESEFDVMEKQFEFHPLI